MARPLIGITTGLSESRDASQVVDHRYVAAVERAGGCPALLPMTESAAALEPLLGQLGGLVITGGPGIVRGLVGDLPPDLPPVTPLRDAADTWAFESMRRRARPVLGICYGMQFINAACGGTLYADVQAQLRTQPHSPGRNEQHEVQHPLQLVAGTRLAALAGAEPGPVNSFHLQAVERLGAGLRLNALGPEGVVEGLESEDGLLLGVQFHPERMPGTVWDRLFTALVRAAL